MHCWWECINKTVQPLWKTEWWFLKNLNIELPYDLAIPLLGIYPKELKAGTQIDICTPMFKAAKSFTIAKKWKQPTVHQQMNKQNVVYTHNRLLFSLKKEGNSDSCWNRTGSYGPCPQWTQPVFCLWKNFSQRVSLIREVRKCRNKGKQFNKTK